MALTASKYIIPSGSPIGSNQSTQSAAYGDAEIGASLESLSSGLVSYTSTIAGTALSVNATSEIFSHGDFICRVVDNVAGSVTSFTVAAATGVTPTLLASAEVTYLGANSANSALLQQATPFTPEDRRTIVPIGRLLHHDKVDLTEALFLPDVARANSSSFNDFLQMTGPVTSGFKIGLNTVNKALSIGPGRIMLPGIGMTSSGSIAPNTIEFVDRPDYQAFKHVTQDGTVGVQVTEVDTTNYNPTAGTSTLTLYASGWCATRSIWQGFDGTVYVLYPTQRDGDGEQIKTQNTWYHQPVPHWLWEVAVPIALLTAEYNVGIFDNSVLDTVTPIIDQLQPIPTNWPYRTVQATVFPS